MASKYDSFDSVGEQMKAFLEEIDAEGLAEGDEEGMQFQVLFHDDKVFKNYPVVLWIHPGDSCEHDCNDEEVRDNAKDFERFMGEEISCRFDTHRLVVLHRQSTNYAFEPDTTRVAAEYWDAMSEAITDSDVIHLWGDDLDEASKWILENLGEAPSFFLTGAWSNSKDGCVAAVGKSLVRVDKEVAISSWSPSEPGSVADVWNPREEKEKIAKKMAKRNLKP